MRIFPKTALLALVLLAGSAQAVEVKNLYGGQTIVTGIYEPARSEGLSRILLDVLIKVSAEPKLLDDPRVRPLQERVGDFVTGFDYEDRMKGTPIRDEQGTRQRPHDLRATFDKAKIDAALADLGLQPWGSDRPALAAFVVVRYPDNAYVLSADAQQGLGQRQALEAAGIRRGMKTILPAQAGLGDLTPQSLATLPPDALRQRATDQGGDAALVGIMQWQPDGAFWRTAWQLADKDFNRRWSVDSTSFDEAFRNGVGEAAATLAGHR